MLVAQVKNQEIMALVATQRLATTCIISHGQAGGVLQRTCKKGTKATLMMHINYTLIASAATGQTKSKALSRVA